MGQAPSRGVAHAPVIANGRISRSGSARSRAISMDARAARRSPSCWWAIASRRWASTRVRSGFAGAVPSSTGRSAWRAASGSWAARCSTAVALRISPVAFCAVSSAARALAAWSSQSEAGLGGDRPGGHPGGQCVSAGHAGLHRRGGGEFGQGVLVLAACGVKGAADQVQKQSETGFAAAARRRVGAVEPCVGRCRIRRSR